jgi:Ca-activated chloride channel family protein
MRFADPLALWLLVAMPLLALASGRLGRAAALLFPSAELARSVGRARTARTGWIRPALRALAASLLVIALARPQQGMGAAEIETEGIDIMLAVDVSGSMRALDFQLEGEQVSRLEAARSVVAKFVDARPNDRIGMVAFAGRPYLVSPLTLDHDWLQQNLDRLRIGLVEDGTAIGSAIAASANRLRSRKSKSRIVILLTDGVSNAGKVSPLAAAEAASALDLKVYTILAGTGGEVSMPVTDQYGRERVATVEVEVDPETLEEIARITDAASFQATDTESLAQIYERIDQLERTTEEMKRFERYRELYAWPLLIGLSLLGLELILGETRLRRLP